MREKSSLKSIVKILVIVVVTLLSLVYVLHDDPLTTFRFIGDVSFFPFFLAILLVALIPFLDALSLTFFTRLYHPRYRYRQALVNTLIGNFIGCLNKTGAMFIQAYTFTKQDVQGAHAASILTMNFLMYQIGFTLFSLFVVVFGYPFVENIPIALLGSIRIFPLSLIGLSLSLLMLLIIVSLSFFKPVHRFIMSSGISLLSRLHILKNPDETRKKWTLQFATYRIELKRLSRHSHLVFLSLLINGVKLLVYASLPYLVFWAMNIPSSSLSFPALFSGAGYLQLISSFLVVGAPEVGFQSIFSYLLSQAGLEGGYNIAAAGNLLWRLLTFYLPLVVGALFYFVYKGAPRRYELLSNTATILDLQVLNLQETNDKGTREFLKVPTADKKGKEQVLLTKKDVLESFARIRKNMEKESTYQVAQEEKDRTMTLEIQKKQLARAIQEADELRKMFQPDPEIEKEVHQDLDESRKRIEKKEEKKRRRKSVRKESWRRKP